MHPKEIEIDGEAYALADQQAWIDVIAQLDKREPGETVMVEIPSPVGGSWFVQVSPVSRVRYYYPPNR